MCETQQQGNVPFQPFTFSSGTSEPTHECEPCRSPNRTGRVLLCACLYAAQLRRRSFDKRLYIMEHKLQLKVQHVSRMLLATASERTHTIMIDALVLPFWSSRRESA